MPARRAASTPGRESSMTRQCSGARSVTRSRRRPSAQRKASGDGFPSSTSSALTIAVKAAVRPAWARMSSISRRSAPEAIASGTRAARAAPGTRPPLIAASDRPGQTGWRAPTALSRIETHMKSTFRPRLLNGHTGDPALLLSLRWQGRALLVDLGRIDRTPAPLLLPIEAVFVSHTHMDHFMGFDQLLRLLL